ncbi:hypothetical protein D3C74_48600 [compost metagenome]
MNNYRDILDQLFKTDPEILRARLKELEIERKVILSILEKETSTLIPSSSHPYESPIEVHEESSQANDVSGEATLTEADLSYNNLRFGIKTHIAKSLPLSGTVKVVFQDISIEGTIPPSVRGRINGVHLYKKLPDLFKVGSKLTVKYSKADRTLNVLNVEN